MQHRSRAIVLRRTAYGEADWIVAFYCRERGRLSGIARSARASKKRFAGALEPGAIVDLRFMDRRGSELVQLQEAQVAVPMHGFLRSLPRIEALSRTLAIALAFLREGEANPAKFDLLAQRLVTLCEREPDPFETAAFELKWLVLSGYAPVLGHCAGCGHEADGIGRWRFSFERGGFVCPRCSPGSLSAHALSDGAMRDLIALAAGEGSSDSGGLPEAGALIGRYMEHVLGRPIQDTRL